MCTPANLLPERGPEQERTPLGQDIGPPKKHVISAPWVRGLQPLSRPRLRAVF